MKNRIIIAALFFVVVLAGSDAMAQDTNLSGTWTLDVARSNMGSEHPSNEYRLTKTIKQTNGLFSISDSSVHASMAGMQLPDSVVAIEIATDGKEHEIKFPSVFPGIPEMTGKASAVWAGCTLEVRQSIPAFGSTTKQRLFLSEDHSQLIVLVEGHSTFLDTEQRLVFERNKP